MGVTLATVAWQRFPTPPPRTSARDRVFRPRGRGVTSSGTARRYHRTSPPTRHLERPGRDREPYQLARPWRAGRRQPVLTCPKAGRPPGVKSRRAVFLAARPIAT